MFARLWDYAFDQRDDHSRRDCLYVFDFRNATRFRDGGNICNSDDGGGHDGHGCG